MTDKKELRPSPWFLSSFTDGVQCVAVQFRGDEVAVRSTNRPEQGELVFAASEWASVLAGVEADDLNAVRCIKVHYRDDEVAIRSTSKPEEGELVFSATEWAAFLSGVGAGDFSPALRIMLPA